MLFLNIVQRLASDWIFLLVEMFWTMFWTFEFDFKLYYIENVGKWRKFVINKQLQLFVLLLFIFWELLIFEYIYIYISKHSTVHETQQERINWSKCIDCEVRLTNQRRISPPKEPISRSASDLPRNRITSCWFRYRFRCPWTPPSWFRKTSNPAKHKQTPPSNLVAMVLLVLHCRVCMCVFVLWQSIFGKRERGRTRRAREAQREMCCVDVHFSLVFKA